MDITARHHFDRPIEEVWAMFLDPAAHEAKYEAMGHRDIRVLKAETDDGALLITIERTVDTEVPSIARKFIHPANTVTTTDRWGVEPDGVRTGRTTLDVKGVPMSSSAVATLTPDAAGTGCDYTVVLSASLKIPLVGGKILGALKPQLVEQMDAEFRANAAWLADHQDLSGPQNE